jgi:hypothetical protein
MSINTPNGLWPCLPGVRHPQPAFSSKSSPVRPVWAASAPSAELGTTLPAALVAVSLELRR